MSFDCNFIKNRAIIHVSEEGCGVNFTHWARRRRSWSIRWQDVVAIDAMVVEVPCFELGFIFQTAEGWSGFLSDDMENWKTLVEAVRRHFPSFNWENVDAARRYENRDKRVICWRRRIEP